MRKLLVFSFVVLFFASCKEKIVRYDFVKMESLTDTLQGEQAFGVFALLAMDSTEKLHHALVSNEDIILFSSTDAPLDTIKINQNGVIVLYPSNNTMKIETGDVKFLFKKHK